MTPEDRREHSPFEAHPFRRPDDDPDSDRCALCGERRVQILHHPTRIQAAQLLRDAEREEPERTAAER